jgi:hypothetical protein
MADRQETAADGPQETSQFPSDRLRRISSVGLFQNRVPLMLTAFLLDRRTKLRYTRIGGR